MRVMSLFAGYGGLDLALGMVFPEARTVYVSDIEEGPCRVLAHRFPEATNLGDVTAVDWDSLDPVDVVIGGSPCPDLSDAGRGAGMRPGTRSGLWSSMVDAIAATRPRLVVWENVRGALSKSAFSRLESGEGRMGGRADGVVLRALGRVLGDLSALGYDCQWSTFRASTIGAPHQRERVFVVAVPSSQGWRLPWHTVTREAACGWASALDSGCSGKPVNLLPTPTVGDKGGECARSGDGYGAPLGEVVRLLPTPTATYSGNSPEEHLRKKPGRTKVTDLRILVEDVGLKLLPTPKASDGEWGTPSTTGRPREKSTFLATQIALLPTPMASDAHAPSQGDTRRRTPPLRTRDTMTSFGDYVPAITRWEQVIGRTAPSPTIPSPTGKPRLSHHFTEWMMGLPEGWICDPALWVDYPPTKARSLCLRMAGNGVVPQQAAWAIHALLNRATALAAGIGL